MKPRLISLLVANLFFVAPVALAQQNLVWSGSASLGVRDTNENASDPSKLYEYRDLDSDYITNFDLRGRSNDYYINAFGENLTNRDRYLDLWGGRYGVFKYQIYSNELRHWFGSAPAVRTPYSGVGSDTLVAPFPAAPTAAFINPNSWNAYDSYVDRRDLGGFFEWSATSPWYFRVDANEVKREGVRNVSASQGMSPGNGFVELPRPVDWTTTNWGVEGGYQSRRANVALNVSHSRFSNGVDVLRFSNGFFAPGVATLAANLDSKPLEPDNDLIKWALNGNLKQLPWNSTLSGRFTWSKLTNSVSVLQSTLAAGPVQAASGPNTPTFDGEIVNSTASVSLSSQPMRNLDTRLYWHWQEKENNNTRITFTAPLLGCATACEPELFTYKKNNLGAEAGYRLNASNKVSVGLDYLETDRHRVDFHKTDDAKFFVTWKNNTLGFVDTRVKYQRLNRRSDLEITPAEIVAVGTPMEQNLRRFDFADVDQDLLKIGFDISPRQFLDFGIEAIYKHNNYRNTPLGRTDDQRQELYASVGYGDPNSFRVLFFGDVEHTTYDSRHRVGSCGIFPDEPPQSGPPCVTAPAGVPPQHNSYTWTSRNKDRSWQLGLGADWKPIERLKLHSSFLLARTQGSTDFSTNATLVPPLGNIGNVDNTRRTSFNLKGTYAVDKRFDVTAGYAFERYRFSDIGFDDFGYVARAANTAVGTTANSYATGEGAFQNYNANIVYLIGTYKF